MISTPSDAAVRLCISHGLPANICDDVLNAFGRDESLASEWIGLVAIGADPPLPNAELRALVAPESPMLTLATERANRDIEKAISAQSLKTIPMNRRERRAAVTVVLLGRTSATTVAPRAFRAVTIATPSPLVAPVTSTRAPSSSRSSRALAPRAGPDFPVCTLISSHRHRRAAGPYRGPSKKPNRPRRSQMHGCTPNRTSKDIQNSLQAPYDRQNRNIVRPKES